jgi:gamma-glutamyl-gamma-aminobutyraldehyde dehydrogenase
MNEGTVCMTDWHARARGLSIEGRAFVNGKYCDAADGSRYDCISPIDGRTLQSVARCGPLDVEQAVGVARSAFNSGVWSRLAPRARQQVLLRWAALIDEHADELGLLESLDAGKPITDAISGDVPAAVHCLRWFAEAIDKRVDELIPGDGRFLSMVTREPMGVVAAVVPWNYPLLMAAWKFAPALAMGNSVILKPSERSPLSVLLVARLGQQAGLPDGIFNVLPGFGDVGSALASHHQVDCVAFTGSGATGRRILHAAADSNLKRVWLELGGKSPNIVLADCPDLARAGAAAAAAIFSNMGEVCSAGSRLLVQRSIRDKLIDHVIEASRGYPPADPLDPSTAMGPLIDEAHLARVLGYIARGREEATLLTGGCRARIDSGGFYVEPTVFLGSDPAACIAREEIFGPVLTVLSFEDDEEAMALANGSDYGLAAAVWTADMRRAHTMAGALQAGTVWVNCYDELADMNLPFGGFKQSGNGRDNSLHALDKYAELKSTIVRLG